MSNTGIDYLYPEFWAGAFEEGDFGDMSLPSKVSRKFESQLGSMGDTVNVPLIPDMGDADDYDVTDDTLAPTNVAQALVPVVLNLSKRKTFILNSKELSLTPYNLIETYGIPAAESILENVNSNIYMAALGATQFAYDAMSGIDADSIISVKKLLDASKVGKGGRVLAASSDVINQLLADTTFKYAAYNSQGGQAQQDGIIPRKFGFDISENAAISKYTPADVAGAINFSAGFSTGDTVLLVDAFNDDTAPVRVGDIVTIAGEADPLPKHTVTATVKTTGDTTSITISPALTGNVADNAVVTVVPTESMIGFHPSAIALAARPYGEFPAGVGVLSTIKTYKDIPVRVSVWAASLKLKVQFDILYGVKLVHAQRVARMAVA